VGDAGERVTGSIEHEVHTLYYILSVGDAAERVTGIVHEVHILFFLWGMLQNLLQVLYMKYILCSGCGGDAGELVVGIVHEVHIMFWLWGMLQNVLQV
jgi:fucose permease